MNRKNEIRCPSISSELKNASMVKNKCEQLKLEKQHKSLDRLRANEKINLTNKRKEILDLQMAILSSKPADEFADVFQFRCIDDMHKMKLQSRTLSTSTSSIDSFINRGNARPLRKMSRSCSTSGKLDYFRPRKFTTPGENISQGGRMEEESTSTDKVESSPCAQAVWTLLPPIQLTPLYKQKYKSLKETASHFDLPRSQDACGSARDQIYAPKRRMSVPQETVLHSWNDLQDCRYLRCRNNRDSSSDSYVAREAGAKDPAIDMLNNFKT